MHELVRLEYTCCQFDTVNIQWWIYAYVCRVQEMLPKGLANVLFKRLGDEIGLHVPDQQELLYYSTYYYLLSLSLYVYIYIYICLYNNTCLLYRNNIHAYSIMHVFVMQVMILYVVICHVPHQQELRRLRDENERLRSANKARRYVSCIYIYIYIYRERYIYMHIYIYI